jgi:hypothetical protein
VKSIFISYRRNDSAVFTGRLFDRLTEYYGANSVFLDIDSIPGAADFRDVVKLHIKKCGVFLAVIGRQWAGSPDRPRRIDDPADHVRIEIEQAIADKKPVIPVYCDDLDELKPADIPSSLQPLVYANARRVDPGRDFHQHVQRLRREINRILFPSNLAVTAHVARRFARRNKGWLATWAVAALLVILGRNIVGRTLLTTPGLQTAVERTDPSAFSRGEGGTYQIARALPDRKALVSETDMVDTIRQSKQTFDTFALTGSVFFNNTEALEDGLRRGVRFRILLLDHGDANRTNVECYFRHCGINSNGLEWSSDNAKLAYATFRRLRREAKASQPGSIEVRWWPGPFLNSFWVRDSGTANALSHAELTYYGDVSLNPSVRFGRLSPQMIASLQVQFDYLWSKSPAESDD